MSKLTSIFLILIFLVSLILGILLGGEVSPPDPTSTAPVPISKNITISTVLVLGVNNFEDNYLESVWIATLSRSQVNGENIIELILVSVYPGGGLDEFLTPHQPIPFPEAYLYNLEAFELLNSLPVLQGTDIYFQDVVVIDEFGMNYLIALNNLNPTPEQAPFENTFILPWDDPQRSHTMQRNILETLCAPPQNLLQYENFLKVFNLSPHHLKTTLATEEIVLYWLTNINLEPPPTINCFIYP
jgi:hypothetical protein